MDQSHISFVPSPEMHAVRHDGWTADRKAQFLEHLSAYGDVRAACRSVGLSREAAYRLRRRDAVFGRAWAAALVLAREAGAEMLANRALNGVEEEVWHAGQMVGTRIRFDSRLLLAHLARLDRLAEGEDAQDDAARFDELVALAAGVASPEDRLITDEDGLPLAEQACVDFAADVAAEIEREEAEEEAGDYAERGEEGEALRRAIDIRVEQARWQAAAETADAWHAWINRACASVNALLQGDLTPVTGTVSTVST